MVSCPLFSEEVFLEHEKKRKLKPTAKANTPYCFIETPFRVSQRDESNLIYYMEAGSASKVESSGHPPFIKLTQA